MISDLAKRLRDVADDMEFAISLETEAANKLEALQAEITRLRELVEKAFKEGFADGLLVDPRQAESDAWSVSDTRKALEQKP